jgi:hypothetical protein
LLEIASRAADTFKPAVIQVVVPLLGRKQACGPVLVAPVVEARAWVGISPGRARTRRYGRRCVVPSCFELESVKAKAVAAREQGQLDFPAVLDA